MSGWRSISPTSLLAGTLRAEATLAAAHDLAERLKPIPFRTTRVNARVPTARLIQAGLDADIASFEVHN